MKQIALIIATLCFTSLSSLAQIAAKLDPSEIYERSINSVVVAVCSTSDGVTRQGTGVILRGDGVIVTDYHVCGDAANARIKMRNGDIYDQVSIVEIDEKKDIVVMKIKATGLPALPVADSDAVKIGSTVYAIGAPLGLEGSITNGIISSVRPANEMFTWADNFKIIQFTAPVAHGSSGSPLLNDRGQVVGLAFAIKNEGQNLNAAIPINYVTPLLDSKKEGTLLGKLSPKDAVSRLSTTESVEEIAGTFTGDWASNDEKAQGELVLTVSFAEGVPTVKAVFTGSKDLTEDVLDATFTSMGNGVWKMEYVGKKSRIKGTAVFKGGRSIGDYKFRKLVRSDNGQWVLEKAS